LGDLTIRRHVLGQIRVEQVQRDAAHAGLPGLSLDVAFSNPQGDDHGLAVVQFDERDRCLIEVGRRILLELPAVRSQALLEIALPIHQADADERNSQIAGALEVVAREDAQSAGVDRQALVNPELHREVGDAVGSEFRVRLLEPALTRHVGVERLEHAVHFGQIGVIVGRLIQALLRDVGQELNRIPGHLVPEVGVQPPKQLLGFAVPTPVQVVGKFSQPR